MRSPICAIEHVSAGPTCACVCVLHASTICVYTFEHMNQVNSHVLSKGVFPIHSSPVVVAVAVDAAVTNATRFSLPFHRRDVPYTRRCNIVEIVVKCTHYVAGGRALGQATHTHALTPTHTGLILRSLCAAIYTAFSFASSSRASVERAHKSRPFAETLGAHTVYGCACWARQSRHKRSHFIRAISLLHMRAGGRDLSGIRHLDPYYIHA